MIVYATNLLEGAESLSNGLGVGTLSNGVTVTAAQLRKAGEILRDGPQPYANGIKSDMPGFIEPEDQTGKSLIFQVGILPARIWRIDSLGRARRLS